jgi:hypothetical protein
MMWRRTRVEISIQIAASSKHKNANVHQQNDQVVTLHTAAFDVLKWRTRERILLRQLSSYRI